MEDTANPNMWLKIIRKFLPASVRVSSVTPLGGREKVLEACKADQASSDRRRLYIIDADLDAITGARKPRLRHLYRLRRYCIENYLLHRAGVAEVVMSLSPKISLNNALSLGDVEKWVGENERNLRALFVAYAVAKQLGSKQETIGFSCYKLMGIGDDFKYSDTKVRSRVFGVYRGLLKEFELIEVKTIKAGLISRAVGMSPLVYCSAKSHILPALFSILKKAIHVPVSMEVFKTMLAEHIDVQVDPFFRKRLVGL